MNSVRSHSFRAGEFYRSRSGPDTSGGPARHFRRIRGVGALPVLLPAAMLLSVPAGASSSESPGNPPEEVAGGGSSRPKALLLMEDFGALLVAGGAGSVFVLDVRNRTDGKPAGSEAPVPVAPAATPVEIPIGSDITGLARLPPPPAEEDHGRKTASVVAVDHGAHRLHLLRIEPAAGDDGGVPRVRVEGSFPTCRYPVRAAARGPMLAVSCLWSRKLLLHDAGAGFAAPEAALDLPFEARELLFAGPDALLVADAFSGGLAVVGTDPPGVLRIHELPGHNLRGLALLPGGDRVAIAHQQLHPGMHTSADDIRWGVFITNSVSLLRLDDLRGSDRERLSRRTRVLDLGSVRTPSGDPSAVAIGPEGRLVVALSGVGRLAVGRPEAHRVSHVPVGDGPVALAIASDGRAFAANTWSGSVSEVSLDARRETGRTTLGEAGPSTPERRGEALFHDARLSLRGWMSCASCHSGGHTNHRLSDTLGDDRYGEPKRVLSLLGVADTGPWAWNGRVRTLEEQVRKSVRTTLRGRELAGSEVADLVAYMRSLRRPEMPPPPSPPGLVAAGRSAFSGYGCARCHREPSFTSAGAHRVAPRSADPGERFNPPSLLGARFRRALFHDASASSLEEALRAHPEASWIDPEDLPALLAFLRSL